MTTKLQRTPADGNWRHGSLAVTEASPAAEIETGIASPTALPIR
jgi:hypothetical protein